MCAGERPSAPVGVEGESCGTERLDLSRNLHVTELAPVQVAIFLNALRPAQVDVARGLHQPLSLNHSFPWLLVAAFRQMILEHRSACLLDL